MNDRSRKSRDKRTSVLSGWLMVAMLVMLGLAVMLRQPAGDGVAELPYSRFKELVAAGAVDTVEFTGQAIEGTLKVPVVAAGGGKTNIFVTRVPPVDDPQLMPALEAAGVAVSAVDSDSGLEFWLVSLLPWILIVFFWIWIWRRMAGGVAGGFGRAGMDSFLKGRMRKVEPADTPKVRFADVAGQDNAKAEVAELLEFLRDPGRYLKLGASVPHGILLQGPPGTGKTMLARALAGEAGVPFYYLSASEFIELFVGVGAARVRNLFDDAKSNAPSIIFIDELDSIGRVRGTGIGGGHDEREQTLNQILAELDGFEQQDAVVVLAATNRPDVLDPALLRPGRFDRHITLELPDLAARRAILKVHTRNVPLADGVDVDLIAASTPGFSGADLKNLVNEAAMAAARDNRETVSQQQFETMRDRIIMGSVRTLAIHDEERHRLAVHEAGHAAVAFHLDESDPVHKVTIIPRGRALGNTQQLPVIERHTFPEAYLRDRLAVLLAGRAAEETFLGSLSSGADDDIRNATQLARWMVGRWGMSEAIGPVDVSEGEQHPFLGREIAQPRHTSEETAAAADAGIRVLLVEAEGRAKAVLERHRESLERLIAKLEAEETLDASQIAACLTGEAAKGTAVRAL